MNATDVDGLETPRDCSDVGYSYGLDGTPADVMLAALTAEAGELTDWQVQSLLSGREAGLADAEAYRREMAEQVALPVYDDSDIPY